MKKVFQTLNLKFSDFMAIKTKKRYITKKNYVKNLVSYYFC